MDACLTEFREKFPRRTGISRICYAGLYSLAGLRRAWISQAAFRQELVLACVLLPAAFWVGQTVVERLLLVAVVVLVLIVELCNSAIEAIVDRIGTELHPLSGAAKDMGSAAVLLSLLLALLTWALLILQRVAE